GRRPRADILRALAAPSLAQPRAAHDAVSLVIATDLLSEGVNLQGAGVVVHLDIPWTPAGLEQRVGRAARLGSARTRVHVYGIAPPRSAERVLALSRRLAEKESQGRSARAPAT